MLLLVKKRLLKKMRMYKHIEIAINILSLTMLTACGASKLDNHRMSGLSDPSHSRCNTVGVREEMWLVDLEPAAKVRLQTLSEKEIVLAVFRDCRLEMLRGCEVGGNYSFTPTQSIRNTEYIRTRNELFAKLPLGAVELNAQYKDGTEWFLEYILTGSVDSTVSKIDTKALPAHCREATHFIQGMVVGAYQLRSSKGKGGGAQVTADNKAGIGGGEFMLL